MCVSTALLVWGRHLCLHWAVLRVADTAAVLSLFMTVCGSAPPCSTGGAMRLVRAGRCHACWAGVQPAANKPRFLADWDCCWLVWWLDTLCCCRVGVICCAHGKLTDSLRLRTTIVVVLEVLCISWLLCFASLLCYAHECVGRVTVCGRSLRWCPAGQYCKQVGSTSAAAAHHTPRVNERPHRSSHVSHASIPDEPHTANTHTCSHKSQGLRRPEQVGPKVAARTYVRQCGRGCWRVLGLLPHPGCVGFPCRSDAAVYACAV